MRRGLRCKFLGSNRFSLDAARSSLQVLGRRGFRPVLLDAARFALHVLGWCAFGVALFHGAARLGPQDWVVDRGWVMCANISKQSWLKHIGLQSIRLAGGVRPPGERATRGGMINPASPV